VLLALEILETSGQTCHPVAAGESRACSRKVPLVFLGAARPELKVSRSFLMFIVHSGNSVLFYDSTEI